MTKQEAKELSLEVWRYLAEHTEINRKYDLPHKIFNTLQLLKCKCPLCELFEHAVPECRGCPLRDVALGLYDCTTRGHPYRRWYYATRADTRRQSAMKMVQMIEAWEVDE